MMQAEMMFKERFFCKLMLRGTRERGAGLKRIFTTAGKSETELKILSMQGGVALNARLAEYAPESAALTCTLKKITDFRSKPRFDLIFYPLPASTEDTPAKLLENICYLRMLLKPGAFLFLVSEGSGRRSKEDSWLQQAGFMGIKAYDHGREFRYIGGQRPLQDF